MRFARLLSLLLVFCLASTFTLASAFACEPSALAVASHCHQAEKSPPAPVNGPAFARVAAACPMLAEFNARPVSLSASSVKQQPIQPAVILARVSAQADERFSPEILSPRPPAHSRLPLYLQRRVLRL